MPHAGVSFSSRLQNLPGAERWGIRPWFRSVGMLDSCLGWYPEISWFGLHVALFAIDYSKLRNNRAYMTISSTVNRH